MIEDVFAKIIARELPAEILYENEETMAILDINPNTPGHTLVIPKKTVLNVLDADEDTFLAVMKTVHALAPVIKRAMGASGINVHINNEPAAGQVVPHLHVHIIPRYPGDGLRPWPARPYEGENAEKVADSIRKEVEAELG